MSFDTSDAGDVGEATNAAQEAEATIKPLSATGMKSMQGEHLDAGQPETPNNDVPVSPESPAPQDQGPVDDPDSAPRPTIIGEKGLAEWVESGPEKLEKEIFTGFGGGIEGER